MLGWKLSTRSPVLSEPPPPSVLYIATDDDDDQNVWLAFVHVYDAVCTVYKKTSVYGSYAVILSLIYIGLVNVHSSCIMCHLGR